MVFRESSSRSLTSQRQFQRRELRIRATSVTLPQTRMSLVPGYSSDEDDGPSSPTNDAFGLSHIPTAKKVRVDEHGASLKPQAAPHVLAEVRALSLLDTLEKAKI